MASIHKLTKNGQTIYPATTTDAVVHPDLAVSSSKLIEEVNVSKIFPTGGIDGTNKYTLETAIAMIPTSLRSVGIKCSFLDEDNKPEVWMYNDYRLDGNFIDTRLWLRCDGDKINAIGKDLDNAFVYKNYTEGYLASGVIQSNSSYRTTDFIGVIPGEIYVAELIYRIDFFTRDKAYIPNSEINNPTEFSIPENAWYVRYSIGITNIDRGYFNIKSKEFVVKDAEYKNLKESVDKLAFSPIWVSGYYSTKGEVINDDNYKRTELFGIRPNTAYHYTGVLSFFDINKAFIARAQADLEVSPDNAYYAAIYTNAGNIEKVYFYDPSFALSIVPRLTELFDLTQKVKTIEANYANPYVDKFTVNFQSAEQLADYNITCSGNIGAVGAVYTIPIQCRGSYEMTFRFRLPRDLNLTETDVQLAKLDRLNGPNINSRGGFIIDIHKKKPVVNAPYAQPKYQSGISWYVNKKDNNYRGDYTPGIIEKPFVGADAFSIRYMGDVSQSANRDIVLDISNNGMTVRHSGGTTIWHKDFPDNKSMHDFIQSLIDDTEEGGAQNGVFEINVLLADGDYTTDDLIRVSGIPLVGDYSSQHEGKGWQAFPCFLSYIDDAVHTIDVRFDGKGDKGYHLISVFLDGKMLSVIDSGYKLGDTANFDAPLTLGGEGIEIIDFSFNAYDLRISHPKISVVMLHNLHEGLWQKDGFGEGNITSLGGIQRIAHKFWENGFSFVPLSAIESYYHNGISLPDRCYTIIHDDYYYLKDTTPGSVSNDFREFYKRNNMKVSFAMIMDEAKEDVISAANKDKDVFEFHLHSVADFTSLGYEELLLEIREEQQKYRDALGDTNIFTYPYGAHDYNTIKIFSQLGIAFAGIVGNNGVTGLTLRNNATSYPRYNGNDDTLESIFKNMDLLSKI